jgi:benzaldehyde dehydrogenase (NAD)
MAKSDTHPLNEVIHKKCHEYLINRLIDCLKTEVRPMTANGERTWPDAAEWTGMIYSDGWRKSEGGTQPVNEPATGERLAEVGVATPADVASAGASAARAQRAWALTAPPERAEVMLRAARALREHSGVVREWIVRETGGVHAKADYEIVAGLSQLTQAAGLASLPRGEILTPSLPGQASYASREPLGVVGVINPWNAPLLFAMRAIAPALVLGNAVLLKPDPHTPVSGGVLVARLFEDAGLPEGLLHVLPGGTGIGQAVVTDPHIAMVSFTGSTGAGRAVARAAGSGLKRVALELGGKNAFVVLEDADVDAAAAAGAMSSFGYQGQACVAAGRHLVHADLVAAYTEALVRQAKALRVGDPREEGVAIGPIISERQAARIERIVDESVAAGARVLAGGRRDRLFYPPTVLDHVERTMPAYSEEIFGPVAPIIAFRTDAEAVEIANDTEYGLTAAVHSRSVPRATLVAGQLRTGMVHINDVSAKDAANAPFGGVGASGNGSRIGGTASLEQFTQRRWTTTGAA